MKRILFPFILLLFAVSVHAQWKLTPEVGATITKSSFYNAGIGAKIGANVRYSFNNEEQGLGIRSGLYYVQRNTTSFSGGQIFYNMPGSDETNVFLLATDSKAGVIPAFIPEHAELQSINTYYIKTRKDYLQLPVLIEYAWNLSSSLRYHIAAGPYVAIGISGKDKTYSTSWEFEGEAKSDISTKSPFSSGVKGRFDAGASIQTGLQINQFSFILNYDLNIYKRDLYGKGHSVSFCLGYTI